MKSNLNEFIFTLLATRSPIFARVETILLFRFHPPKKPALLIHIIFKIGAIVIKCIRYKHSKTNLSFLQY